jgi:hypothetical protein
VANMLQCRVTLHFSTAAAGCYTFAPPLGLAGRGRIRADGRTAQEVNGELCDG